MAQAEERLFGVTLLNDWSARDMQAWEYQPLGPFLAKSFATTISPWVVTLEALAPFRRPFTRPAGDPQPLPYLDSARQPRSRRASTSTLEVWLQTARMRKRGDGRRCGCRSRNAFRTPTGRRRRLVAHHTSNGCNLRTGDLLGTGTLSGPRRGPGRLAAGADAAAASAPLTLPDGETRTFLRGRRHA